MSYQYYADIVRQSVGMKDILALYGLQPNRAGFIQCPLHSEKTASCKIYPDGRGWYCYGCNQGGSVIDFVMGVRKCSFRQAVAYIDGAFRLGLTDRKPDLRQTRELKRAQKEREREEAEAAAIDRRLIACYREGVHMLRGHDPAAPYSPEELALMARNDYLDYAFAEIDRMERGDRLSALKYLMRII